MAVKKKSAGPGKETSGRVPKAVTSSPKASGKASKVSVKGASSKVAAPAPRSVGSAKAAGKSPTKSPPDLRLVPPPAKGARVETVAKADKASKAAKSPRSSEVNELAPPVVGLREGHHAPAFELREQSDALVTSASLAGKPYVLYFYPKDDTPGCTKEACDFRDNFARFARAGVRVLGVSPDTTQSHARFEKKYGLPFTLLSDVDKKLIHAYGVWVKKLNYGREYMGVQRTTFLIDEKGVVRKAYRGVRVNGHVDAVLADAKGLVNG